MLLKINLDVTSLSTLINTHHVNKINIIVNIFYF